MSIVRCIQTVVFAFFLASFLLSSAASAERLLEDFEHYNDGMIIGDGPTSVPWRRFGNATNDNVVVTNRANAVIAGALSAQYCVYWPNKFGSARYAFEEPTDLGEYAAVSFKVRSCDTAHATIQASPEQSTFTTVSLVVSNGETTYESTKAVPLSSKAQTIITYLAESDLMLVDGSQSFEKVVSAAAEIGMTFRSTQGLYTETIVLDDLKLLTQQVAAGKDSDYLNLD